VPRPGSRLPEGLGALARCAIDSLLLSIGWEGRSGRPARPSLSRIHIVGGGCQNRLLDQLCAALAGGAGERWGGETTALGTRAASSWLAALFLLRASLAARRPGLLAVTLVRPHVAVQTARIFAK